MPYSRPGVVQYIAAAANACWHGDPVRDLTFVGVAVKIKAPSAGAGSGTPQKYIYAGEAYNLIHKGEVQVAAVASAVVGSPIYITTANVLTLTVGSNAKFGVVTAIAGVKGCPVGKMRVDLDAKSQF